MKKLLKFFSDLFVEQNALGPAFTRPQNISVTKTAAGCEALEIRQGNPTTQDICHVNVDTSKSSPIESSRHLDFAVDTLLAQDGDLRLRR